MQDVMSMTDNVSVMHREAAAGNDLTSGLKKCFGYLVDLRRLGSSEGNPIPRDHWGNCVTLQFAMPPAVTEAASASPSSLVQATFAAAACAIHQATQALKDDPAAVSKALAFHLSLVTPSFFKDGLAAPGFNPLRDCAAILSSWRNMSIDRVDFGQGLPVVVAGMYPPSCAHLSQRNSVNCMPICLCSSGSIEILSDHEQPPAGICIIF